MGYLLAGEPELEIGSRLHRARPEDVMGLTGELPSHWKDIGQETAELLWVKINK